MKYEKICRGIFIERPNRFIAKVQIDGKIETVHVKNTGRCRELLIPGVTVILEDFAGRKEALSRKTRYDLIAVYKIYPENTEKKPVLINMDSQAPNKVVSEWLCNKEFDFIKPEYCYGDSRIDFYMEKKTADGGVQKYLMEIKGCTLERNGTGYFPDAPTERGVKHLRELAAAATKGINCFAGFVIQVPDVKTVLPNVETHAEFGKALEEAENAGVKILYLQCQVLEDELKIKDSGNPFKAG